MSIIFFSRLSISVALTLMRSACLSTEIISMFGMRGLVMEELSFIPSITELKLIIFPCSK